MGVVGRITNYDRVADRFDLRYSLYEYRGCRETILNFLGETAIDVLDVGCGTGHWLAAIEQRAAASPRRLRAAGVEPSMAMLKRARPAVQAALVRGDAEHLPFADATFDRIFCVNALHHFTDRLRFFGEARRVLRPGGGVMTIGKDPFAERDTWWVYDYFPETQEIDRARFAPVRILRGELAIAGFAWAESFEADHIDRAQPASEAVETGVVDPGFTSQLTVLSDVEFAAGVERLRAANEAAGGRLEIVADFYLYATVGWLQP